MRLALIAVMVLTPLAGCATVKKLNPTRDRVVFEGLYYPSRLSSSRDDRPAFTIAVGRAAQSLSGAREAGRYEATKYCVNEYGQSDVIWTYGPDVDDSGLQLVNGDLVLEGRCDV